MPSFTGTIRRRRFILLSTASLLTSVTFSTDAMAFPNFWRSAVPATRPNTLGTTFSQLQCRYMELDYQAAFRDICTLGLKRIRLCSYWNEIEAIKHEFDFSRLDWLLDKSHQHGIEVVLTVGMKAPRWPEFHFPDWLQARQDTSGKAAPIDQNPEIADRALRFIQQVVDHTRQAPALKYWQVENEPFAAMEITGGRFLSEAFVQREVELVRSRALPEQKLLLTNAISLPTANQHEDDRAFQVSLSLADAVGINVYTKVPAGNTPFYLQPSPAFWRKLQDWQQHLADRDREHWIAEAQAEPWEPNQLVAMQKPYYASASPRQTIDLVTNLGRIGYGTVMLWGCEYWYWQRQNGRNFWWSAMQNLIAA